MIARVLRRLDADAEVVAFTFQGEEMTGRAGDSVAAALLAAGVTTFRTSALTHEPRAAYCMMGACFECLVDIDGVANQQACLTCLHEGMAVTFTFNGAR